MCMKILVFDTDTVSHEDLCALFNNHAVTYAVERFFDEFLQKLTSEAPWDRVLVNFQPEYFWNHSFNDLRAFVSKLKELHPKPFVLVGATGDAYQKEQLEHLGIPVVYKRYSDVVLRESLEMKPRTNLTIEYIERIVCELLGVPTEMLHGKTRKREAVQARQITMFLAKQLTKNTLKTIGEYFGGRDHTTVIHSCQTVKDLMDTDATYREQVHHMTETLSAA